MLLLVEPGPTTKVYCKFTTGNANVGATLTVAQTSNLQGQLSCAAVTSTGAIATTRYVTISQKLTVSTSARIGGTDYPTR